jgi:steroid Delta-isomerase
MMHNTLQGVIDWYQTISPESVTRAGEFYAPDAHFVDPFNDVRGVPAIEQVFRHMFGQVDAPRFVVKSVCIGADQAMLSWDFSFKRASGEHVVPGATHLFFDAQGRVCMHRDYWDPASTLFMELPVIGWVLRKIYNSLRAA